MRGVWKLCPHQPRQLTHSHTQQPSPPMTEEVGGMQHLYPPTCRITHHTAPRDARSYPPPPLPHTPDGFPKGGGHHPTRVYSAVACHRKTRTRRSRATDTATRSTHSNTLNTQQHAHHGLPQCGRVPHAAASTMPRDGRLQSQGWHHNMVIPQQGHATG